MAKFCKHCGNELVAGNEKYCPRCGKGLQGVSVVPVGKSDITERETAGRDDKGSFYLIDFFKRVCRKSNTAVIIYLILNIILICSIVVMFMPQEPLLGVGAGLILYLISMTIALSPLGEWILRIQTSCKKIKDEAYINRLNSLFIEVYAKARQVDPSLSPDIELYMNNDECPNAFATGRKTICITEGLLDMPDELIKATLAHEFGHLCHKDTDLILIVTVGNMIVTGIITFIRLMIYIFQVMAGFVCLFIGGEGGAFASLMNALTHVMITITVSALMWMWTKLGTLLVMKSSRDNEFEADEFAANLGYGNSLCLLLESVGNEKAEGLFATLASSHPGKQERIGRIRNLGI